jgi:3-oxoacyl-[acyl-carrier protein] reductase
VRAEALVAPIALKLASEGARVVVNDLDAEPANETVSAIRAAGGVAVECQGSVVRTGVR